VFILIISISAFSMQSSLLPGGKKLAIPSTSCTAAARCGAPSKNLLAGLQAPLVCAPFQHISLLHSSCRTGHTRRGTASPRSSSTSSCRTYGRFQHLMEIVPLVPSQMSFLTPSTTWSQEIPGIKFYFPSVYTPCRISPHILAMWFLDFLHTPTQNSQDLEKSTGSCDS